MTLLISFENVKPPGFSIHYFCVVKRKKGNIILEKILVEDYAAEGKSLAHFEGKVLFIENAVPGDLIDLKIVKNKKDWAEGFAIAFHSYAKQRIIPFCPHFLVIFCQ